MLMKEARLWLRLFLCRNVNLFTLSSHSYVTNGQVQLTLRHAVSPEAAAMRGSDL